MANPDVARLESLAREGRAQILRMLTHAGSQEGQVWESAMSAPRLGGPGRHVNNLCVHGLGGAVAELLGEACPTPLNRVGVATFGESGDASGLYAKDGLDAAGIARVARALLKR